jgi:hypothetical protein
VFNSVVQASGLEGWNHHQFHVQLIKKPNQNHVRFSKPILKQGPNISFFEEQKPETKTDISKKRIKRGLKLGGRGEITETNCQF